jgi:hypothetical protein
MTIGFAEFLKPAEVVGLDISGDQIAVAERLAADQGVSNVRFEQGTIYQLSFPDQSFIERAIGFELVDRETLSQLNAAWRAWSTDPEAFHARPWCEAVGWVPAA